MGLVAMAVTLGGSAAAVSDAAGVTPWKKKPDARPLAPPPRISDVQTERNAQTESERRRDMYKRLGRSSTILTGPGGLTTEAPGAPKQLLGL